MITQPTIFIPVDLRKRNRNFADYFCRIHTFLAKLVISSQTFISLNWTYSKTRDIIWVRSTFSHQSAESNLSCFTDWTKHASAGALIHRQQTIHWIFTQTKLSSIYRHKPFLSLIGPWRNVKRCLQFRRSSKLAIIFFTFRSRRLCRNPRKLSQECGKRRKTLKFWNVAISKYIHWNSF